VARWEVQNQVRISVGRRRLSLVFSRLERTAVRLAKQFPKEFLGRNRTEATKGMVHAMDKNVWRAVIEVGFIIFLFYSNLLMGEFERSGMGVKRGILWAIEDVFTAANFEIAAIAALIGYILFEFLRKKF
jgi:hypothetical protein